MKVSEDPIRRDLRELAASGLLQRVHGGALIAAPATASYTERQMPAPQERKALACTGAQLIRPWQVAILDGGRTTMQARHLPFLARSISSNN